MTKLSDQETADRLNGRRPGMLIAIVLFFLLQQAAYFSQPPTVTRAVDYVRISGWIVLATVLLAILMRGFWFKSAAVRALMEDEVTRAHRARALETGFAATMIAAICLYVFNLFQPITGRAAIHILLSIGLGFAALHFAALERRALKGG
jgi:hypothetical protein